ncbi:MAG TPA: hypothetical protein DD000_17940 [Cyanobacteria bacterium UBA11166]|nr:hypothetical protein [Cyanobacteria bacterium UBA11166]
MTGRNLKKYSQVRLFLQEAEKYEKVQFELEIAKEIKLSDIDPELLMYTVKKLGIQFPVEFIIVKIPGNEHNES